MLSLFLSQNFPLNNQETFLKTGNSWHHAAYVTMLRAATAMASSIFGEASNRGSGAGSSAQHQTNSQIPASWNIESHIQPNFHGDKVNTIVPRADQISGPGDSAKPLRKRAMIEPSKEAENRNGHTNISECRLLNIRLRTVSPHKSFPQRAESCWKES